MEKVKLVAGGMGSLMFSAVLPTPSGSSPNRRLTTSPSDSASTGSSPTWTAPGRSTSPPPAPPAIPAPAAAEAAAADAPAILDELVDTVDGVRGAVLASVDGFAVARSRSMSDEASHPAMLAAAVGLAHQLVAMAGANRLRKLVVDHDGGLMMVWPIGQQRVLAVLATSTVEQRRVRSFVDAHMHDLAEVAP